MKNLIFSISLTVMIVCFTAAKGDCFGENTCRAGCDAMPAVADEKFNNAYKCKVDNAVEAACYYSCDLFIAADGSCQERYDSCTSKCMMVNDTQNTNFKSTYDCSGKGPALEMGCIPGCWYAKKACEDWIKSLIFGN